MQVIMKLALTLASFGLASAQTVPPSRDSFYTVPANISAYSPGAVIAIREVKTTVVVSGIFLKQAYQVAYRTNRTGGVADLTVATVWVPTRKENETKPPTLWMYSTAEDSTNLDCAPSWGFVSGSNSNNTNLVASEGSIAVSNALDRGYYVVTPDALGSKSGWLAGETEGYAALDAIRATFNSFSLPSNTPVAIYGYSGGAHTAVWAASLAKSYAPSLNITAVAYGGLPTDLRAVVQQINKGPYSWLAAAGFFGLANAYSSLNQYFISNYNAQGRSNATAFRTPGYCAGNQNQAPENQYVDYTKMFNVDVLASGTPLSNVFAGNSLLKTINANAPPAPKMLRYQFHGSVDDIIPVATAQEYVKEQCAQGANIAFELFNGDKHAQAGIDGGKRARYFTYDVLDGSVGPVTCGQPWGKMTPPGL
jgi:dienelactone hydrolase